MMAMQGKMEGGGGVRELMRGGGCRSWMTHAELIPGGEGLRCSTGYIVCFHCSTSPTCCRVRIFYMVARLFRDKPQWRVLKRIGYDQGSLSTGVSPIAPSEDNSA
jgi:hypothetical protein